METQWTNGVLTFRYMTGDDMPPVIAMLAKESVCRYVFFGPNSPEETTAYFGPQVRQMEEALARQQLPLVHDFVVYENATGAFAGQCGIMPLDYAPGNYLIGYQFDEPFWGRGYGFSAGRFIVQYGFGPLNARRLTGDCMADNTGSARIMEKCGFTPEGRQRKHWLKQGRPADNLLFGLLREDVDETLLAAWTAEFEPVA